MTRAAAWVLLACCAPAALGFAPAVRGFRARPAAMPLSAKKGGKKGGGGKGGKGKGGMPRQQEKQSVRDERFAAATREYAYTIAKLKKVLPDGSRTILNGIDLAFFDGAKIGIVGLNGAGKSSLLRIMAGVDKEFDGIAKPGPGVTIGYLPQEPELEGETVDDAIAPGVAKGRATLAKYEELMVKVSDPDLDEAASAAALAELGDVQDAIDAANLWDLDRKVAQSMDALRCPPPDAPTAVLSGGEKRRVALCRLLLENPDMLLLDEPTNHLDCESVAWLERFLADFKGTVVAITHDRYFLENVAQWILELEKGEGKPYEGNYSGWLELKAKRLAAEKRAETALAKQLASELEWVRATPKARQTKSKARLNRYDDLLASAGGGESGPGEGKIFIPPGPRLGDTVINVEHLCKSFGDRQIFQDVNFELPRGAIVGVIGPNGAGKSTMMRMLAAQATDAGGDLVADADGDGTRAPVEGADPRPTVPDSGEIKVGETVKLVSVEQMRGELTECAADATVFDVISEGMDPLPLGTRDVSARAFVSWFGFRSQEQSKRVQKLSGGERGRVHLARVLKSGANVILLDEPTNDLDVGTLGQLEEALLDFGGVAIVVSHDRFFLDRVATHILAFEGDSQVRWFEGNYQEYDADRRARLGEDAENPRPVKFRKLATV